MPKYEGELLALETQSKPNAMEATDSSSEKEDEAEELRLMNHSSLKEQCDITNNISTDCAKDENYLENSGNLVGDSKDTENQAIRIKNEEEVDIENEDKERDMDSIDGEKDDIENFLSQNRFLSKGSANEEEEVCQNRKNIIKTEEKNDEDESTDQSPSDKREVANEPQDVEDGFLKFLKMCAGGKAKAKYLIDQDDEMYGFDDKSESKPSKHRHKKRPPLYRSPNICLSPTPLSVHYEEAYNQKFDFQTDPKQNNHENVIQKPTEIKPQQESGLANEVVDETQYNFSYPQRGHLVLIVNDRFLKQSPRIGANWDLQKTKQIASKLGFRIFNSNHCRNLTKKETIAVLRQAQHHDHSDSDCFMFVISTHGLEIRNPRAKGKLDHVIVCSDDQFIFTSSILDMFNDRNCPTLKNKPKMFFIQACRGEKYDRGSEVLVSRSNGNTDRTDRAGTHESRPDKPADRPRQQKQRSLDVTDTRPSGDSWAASASYRTAVNAQLNQPIRSLTGDASVPNIDDLTNLPTQHSTARVWSSGGQPTLNENQRVTSASQPQMKNNLGENMAPMPYPVNDTPSLQCDNDFLVMYAIPPGYFAWRNTSDGSWMLDYLHSTVMSYDTKDPQDFLKLLRKVSQRMSRRQTNTPSDPKMHESKAIPVIEHKLVKDIIFKPKAVMSKWMRADIYPLI